MNNPIIYINKNNLPKNIKIIEAFDRSLEEFFFIEHPQFKKEQPESKKYLEEFKKSNKIKGVWIYFPWDKKAVHTVPEEIYFKLRTARNRNIITEDEQRNFRNLKIGIVGLSVGSVVLSSLVYNGGPKIFKLADFDEVEITNLNRMKGDIEDVGKNKTIVAAQKVWRLDPFAKLFLWSDGINDKNIEKFIVGKPKLDIFIDTMDSLDLKIKARFICKENKIPVLMITENGDNSILDIERYDLDKNIPIFHGRLGKVRQKDFKSLSYKDWLKLAAKIVGAEYLTEKMQNSLLQLGKTVAAVPQLTTSVNIGGAAITYAVRRIANKEKMPSGRYIINLEEKLIVGYNSEKEQQKRYEKTANFIKRFSS